MVVPVEKGGQVARWPLDRVKQRHRARTFVDPEKRARLKASLAAVGQLEPVIGYREGDFLIVFEGNTRCDILPELGCKEVLVREVPKPTDLELSATVIGIDSNRFELGPVDQALLWSKAMTDSGRTAKQFAKDNGLTESMVSRQCSLLKLCERLRAEANAGKLDLKKYLLIAQTATTEEDQVALAAQAEGVTCDEFRAKVAAAKKKAAKPSAGRITRALLSFPNKLSVTVAAKEVTIPSVVEALTAALEATKKAQRDGVETVATLARVLRERSKKAVAS